MLGFMHIEFDELETAIRLRRLERNPFVENRTSVNY